MGAFARSWDLTKTSWSVIRQDKELLWMPVLAFLASVIAILAVAGAGLLSGIWPEATNADGSANVPGALLAFALYILLAFVALFFNAATVAGAHERLAGGDPTVGSALRAAARRTGRIFLWAVVVATVNLILQAIRERSGMLGQILASLAGTAWNLATYLMVPVLVMEDKGVGASLKRSGSLFKGNWGETAAGHIGLGIAGAVAGFLAFLLGLALYSALATVGLGIVGIVLLVLLVAGVACFFAVLQGVYRAALYRFATTGQEAGFRHDQFAKA